MFACAFVCVFSVTTVADIHTAVGAFCNNFLRCVLVICLGFLYNLEFLVLLYYGHEFGFYATGVCVLQR